MLEKVLKTVIDQMMREYRAIPREVLERMARTLWDELFHPDATPYAIETQVKRLEWVIILNVLKEKDK